MKLLFRSIPEDELDVILQAPNRFDLCFGACIDAEHQTLMLVRGDLATFVVALAEFQPSGDGIVPDFTQLAVVDYGNTIQFGEYEASFDAIVAESEREKKYGTESFTLAQVMKLAMEEP